MYFGRSPPKYSKFKTGGSNFKNKSTACSHSDLNMSPYSNSTNSLLSNSSSSGSCGDHHSHHHYHHHHASNSSSNSNNSSSRLNSSVSTSFSNKRSKRHWGTRERSGMSFLIVIAFFAVFGLIILTEVFMIDERSHNGVMSMRHGNSFSGRLGDSLPDYDDVKDDYDLLDGNILSDNKFGFLQITDNKLKIQEAVRKDGERYAGILLNTGSNDLNGGGGGGVVGNMPLIPWGKVLPAKVEETLPHYPIGQMPTDGSWQVVNGTRFKFFVFSAYYDKRDGAKLVRVVGATKTRSPERVWCRFWYVQRNSSDAIGKRARYTSVTVMARVKVIRENWNLKYSACFVLCPVRSPEIEVPNYVSIVARLRTPPGNILELRNTNWDKDFATTYHTAKLNSSNVAATAAQQDGFAVPTGDQIADKIAICVKPFHFNYDHALYLMEYLEFYGLLGVSHFTFYNHTIGPHASCVLQHYMDGDIPGNLTNWNMEDIANSEHSSKAAAAQQSNSSNNATHNIAQTEATKPQQNAHYVKPTITMLQWNLRMRSQKEIRTEGLFAALNDCLYRTMYRYRYLALVDLDEFIVPRRTDTLNELITSLNRRFRNRNTGAYSFQNAFFYLQFPDDALATQAMDNEDYARVRAALVTQRKTKRRFKLHPQKQRSKYICRPEAVVEAGNHFVWEFAPGKGSLNVPAQEAILQHYRVCEFGGNDCIKAPSIVDRTAIKYVNHLVQRVDAVYKHLKQRCQLPDLPAVPKQTKPNNELKTKKLTDNDQKPKIELKNNSTKLSNDHVNEINTLAQETTSNHDHGNAIVTELTKQNNLTTSRANLVKNIVKRDNFKRKRKMIIFEKDDFGEPIGRIEYV